METRTTGEAVVPTTHSTPPLFITQRPDDANPTFSVSEVVIRTRLAAWVTGEEEVEPDYRYRYSRETQLSEFVIASLCLAVPHLIAAVMIACLVWFWRRRWQWLWLLMPSAVAAFSLSYYRTILTNRTWMQVERDGFDLYVGVIGAVAALQTLVILAGLLAGRPIGRFLIGVLIPPKSRQLFSFLWHCDGKTMPPARTPGDRLPA
jgi:hypothetical protein